MQGKFLLAWKTLLMNADGTWAHGYAIGRPMQPLNAFELSFYSDLFSLSFQGDSMFIARFVEKLRHSDRQVRHGARPLLGFPSQFWILVCWLRLPCIAGMPWWRLYL